MIIRALLVDDEAPARDELAYLLERFPDIAVAEAPNATEALKAIRADRPDLVFLDIEMPGKDGFHVLKEALCLPEPPLFVFVTAYSKYAVQAFEENAVDYLLKPVSTDRLQKSVERVRALMRQKKQGLRQPELERLLGRVGAGAVAQGRMGADAPSRAGDAGQAGAHPGTVDGVGAGMYAGVGAGAGSPGSAGSSYDRSSQSRTYSERPVHDRSHHDRSHQDRSHHDRLAHDRPALQRIAVEEGGRIQLVDTADVVFCERADKRLLVYTAGGCHPCHGVSTLDELEERLHELPFFRANRGTVVNLRQVREFSPWTDGKYCLVMNDDCGTEITLSRGRVKEFKERLGL